ncbi:hypothetical protein [Sphingobium sp. S6]|uniref:hypothetical protein n=1 Tax=Sphingobium sp. S6 TaxID=2758386 RepID=UPI001919B173|nr:hypothetical protein [Sphingobium sp. S6]
MLSAKTAKIRPSEPPTAPAAAGEAFPDGGSFSDATPPAAMSGVAILTDESAKSIILSIGALL